MYSGIKSGYVLHKSRSRNVYYAQMKTVKFSFTISVRSCSNIADKLSLAMGLGFPINQRGLKFSTGNFGVARLHANALAYTAKNLHY